MIPRFKVRFSADAAEGLAAMKAKAATHPNTAEAMTYEAIKKTVQDLIAVPELAMDLKFALKDDLKRVYRVKIGERTRVAYIFSSAKAEAIVLWFGYRKAGDKRDFYEDFRRRVKRGDFDQAFETLGVNPPPCRGSIR